MNARKPPIVAVVGSGTCTPEEAEVALAVGRLLAERGAILVCGGLGGVMEAACRGASRAGGTTVGFLPGTSANAGNPFLTIAIPTGLGEARNMLVARAGRAVIAIGGGYGTLSEIAFALKASRRVISLGTWEARDAQGRRAEIQSVATPQEAVDRALEPQ